jgi:hypothetical protein
VAAPSWVGAAVGVLHAARALAAANVVATFKKSRLVVTYFFIFFLHIVQNVDRAEWLYLSNVNHLKREKLEPAASLDEISITTTDVAKRAGT